MLWKLPKSKPFSYNSQNLGEYDTNYHVRHHKGLHGYEICIMLIVIFIITNPVAYRCMVVTVIKLRKYSSIV